MKHSGEYEKNINMRCEIFGRGFLFLIQDFF